MNSFNIDTTYYNMIMYVILTAYSPADHSSFTISSSVTTI